MHFVSCSLGEFGILCCSHDGDARMGAIESLMRRAAQGVPRALSGLQSATDVAARIPLLRRIHLALSGRGVEACDAREEVGGGEWVWLAGQGGPAKVLEAPVATRRLVFYVHGGAFVLCNPATHRALTCNVARATGALVLAVDYRRPPEHRFPAALDDVLEAYRSVITWFAPSNIIVAGESAGGNLAVGLCLRLSQMGLPLPGGLILMCPWVDLADRCFPSWDECKDYLPPDLIGAFANAYVEERDAMQVLASPIYSESLKVLPRTLLIYGSGETLAGQQEKFGELLRSQGVQLTTYVGPDQVHAFPVYADITYGRLGRSVVRIAALASAAIALAAAAAFAAFVAAAIGANAQAVQLALVCLFAGVLAGLATGWLRRTHAQCTSGAVDELSDSDAEDGEGEEDSEESEDARAPPYEAFRQIRTFAQQVWWRPSKP